MAKPMVTVLYRGKVYRLEPKRASLSAIKRRVARRDTLAADESGNGAGGLTREAYEAYLARRRP